jgi:GT2 family glycosyltransferase
MIANNAIEGESPQVQLSAESQQSPTVLLICVKYGADSETLQYLKSVRRLRGQQHLKVLLIDNAPASKRAACSNHEGYTKIEAGENLGYFGGARYALSQYLESNPLPDWIIISNTDLSIPDPDFLARLADLSSIPGLGALAPGILSELTGKDQNPFLQVRPTALRMHAYKWMYRSRLLLNLYELTAALFHKTASAIRNRANSQGSGPTPRKTIYAPHGSFLILSKSYFAGGGDLRYPEFLFGEEIYIAERIRKMGLKVLYEPSLTVLHTEHRTTKLFKSREVGAYVASSAAYCANTFFPLSENQDGAR